MVEEAGRQAGRQYFPIWFSTCATDPGDWRRCSAFLSRCMIGCKSQKLRLGSLPSGPHLLEGARSSDVGRWIGLWSRLPCADFSGQLARDEAKRSKRQEARRGERVISTGQLPAARCGKSSANVPCHNTRRIHNKNAKRKFLFEYSSKRTLAPGRVIPSSLFSLGRRRHRTAT